MTYFDGIPPNRFALLAAVIGILLNLGLDANEQNALGNFLVTVGQTMLTVAAQSQNLEAHPTKRPVPADSPDEC